MNTIPHPKMMRTFTRYAAGLITGMALTASSLAATALFEDNFQSYTTGKKATSLGNWTLNGAQTGDSGTRQVEVVTDTGNLFGKGVTNQYVRLYNNTPNPNSTALSMKLEDKIATGNSVITLSFNLIEPAGTFLGPLDIRVGKGTIGGSNIANRLVIERGTSRANAVGKIATGPGSATAATFDLDKAYRFDIVFNNSAASVDYNGVSLSSGQYDVWINGVRVITGGSSTLHAYTGDITSVSLQTNTGNNNQQYVMFDWVAVYGGASPIPEPSNLALLLSGASIAGLVIYRRKAKVA